MVHMYVYTQMSMVPVPRITSVGYNLSPSGRKSGFSKNSYNITTKHSGKCGHGYDRQRFHTERSVREILITGCAVASALC